MIEGAYAAGEPIFVIFGEKEYPALAIPGDERSRSRPIVMQGSRATMERPGLDARWRLMMVVLPLSAMTSLLMANPPLLSVTIYARAI